MANSRSSDAYYADATIDTAPGANGYWTDSVGMNKRQREKIFFSVRETGDSASFSATVTVQFKTDRDDDWQDYDTYTSITREVFEMNQGTQFRAGVKNGDYTDGTVTVGFDW
jgi:hypothetical protein